jgi:outer membrane protein assembly factor BamA
MRIGFLLALFFFLQLNHRVRGQKSDSSNSKLIALPFVFYSPETSLGFGALGSYTFKFEQETLNSQVQLGFAYTLEKQWLFYIPFQLFWHNNDYYAYGESGYYLYNYNYFGIGNHSENILENYKVNFPRLQWNFLKRIPSKNQEARNYLGPRIWFEDYDIVEFEAGGEFDQGKVPGTYNNRTAAIGLVSIRDSRDFQFYPGKGHFEEFSIQYDNPAWGSNYKFLRIAYDLSLYHTFKWDDILAVNFFAVQNYGELPFSKMATLGGTKKMRGYYEGRYRDDNSVLLQAAYRKMLFWRIGMEGFAALGSVYPENNYAEIKNLRYTLGGGLRFVLDTERKLNLRLDYGWAPNSSGFYVTIGEAF